MSTFCTNWEKGIIWAIVIWPKSVNPFLHPNQCKHSNRTDHRQVRNCAIHKCRLWLSAKAFWWHFEWNQTVWLSVQVDFLLPMRPERPFDVPKHCQYLCRARKKKKFEQKWILLDFFAKCTSKKFTSDIKIVHRLSKFSDVVSVQLNRWSRQWRWASHIMRHWWWNVKILFGCYIIICCMICISIGLHHQRYGRIDNIHNWSGKIALAVAILWTVSHCR